jgi:hypothetical protein
MVVIRRYRSRGICLITRQAADAGGLAMKIWAAATVAWRGSKPAWRAATAAVK